MVLVTSRVALRECVQACGRHFVLGAIVCLLPSSSFAQTTGGTEPPATETPTPFNIAPPSRPARPYRGVFGLPAANQEPRLTLEASFGVGVNGNPANAQGLGTPGGVGTPGGDYGAGNASATLDYSWTRARIGIGATNKLYADYYPQYANNKFLPRDYANGAFYFVPKRSTRVTISQTFKNLPEFSVSDLHEADLGELLPPNQNLQLTVDRYTRYGTAVDIGQKLSNRSRAAVTVSYARGMIPSKAWTILLFTGMVTHNIGRGLAVYGGYEYGGQKDERLGTLEGPLLHAVRETHPRINGGIDFNRALSFTRRTTLTFSTGTAGTHDRSENRTIYHVIGAARLNREIGRTWNAGLIVSRNVRYIEILSEPLFTDSVGVVVNGSFSRRVEVKSTLSGSTGHLGASAGNGFDTYIGSVQLSVAMTRNLAFGSDYFYSQLSSLRGVLPVDALRQLSQQGVRAYLKFWAPLVTRPRRQ